MTFSRKTVGLLLRHAAWLAVAAGLAGCGTTQRAPSSAAESGGGPAANAATGSDHEGRLRAGELLTVNFTDVSPALLPFQGRIREDGKITLMMSQEFDAAGKTVTELEKDIHDRYVPRYFVNLTSTVKAEDRFFYVDGQVKNPSRQPYLGHITVLGAIAAATGFTDFAKQTSVQVLRANGKIEVVNCKRARKNPKLDLPIYPGDRIIVPRRFW